jgi:hypothetical protein
VTATAKTLTSWPANPYDGPLAARNRKQRRQQHGSAWHWKPTDSWKDTEPGKFSERLRPDACCRYAMYDFNGKRQNHGAYFLQQLRLTAFHRRLATTCGLPERCYACRSSSADWHKNCTPTACISP